jgi:hypothetical protein
VEYGAGGGKVTGSLVVVCKLEEEGLSQPPDILPLLHGPILIQIIRQEFSAPEVQRGSIGFGRPCSTRQRRDSREFLDIDPDVGAQTDDVIMQREKLGDGTRPEVRLQCAAGEMQYLVKIVGCRVRIEIRPENFHCLLSVQPVARRDRQELH